MSKVIRLEPPAGGVKFKVRVPGSKSFTNRALILAALADGESTLVSPSYSDDSIVLISALEKLGVEFQRGDDVMTVKGCAGKFHPFDGEINVGPAGTSMRFLTALSAFSEGLEVVLKGSERMHERPISPLVEALRELGAKIEYLGKEGCPPLKITGRGDLPGGVVKMAGDQSSQYFSALLMAAPLLRGGLEIRVTGEQISRSYIDMTFGSLAGFGVRAENQSYAGYRVQAGLPQAARYQIEGDASGASYLWGLAAVSGGEVKVLNVNPDSTQGDIKFPQLLKEMGCEVSSGVEGSDRWIEVRGSALSGITADMDLMPDTAQTLAVIAATASSPTTLSGLSTLRIKETDRIAALQNELSKLGIRTDAGPDSLTVFPGPIAGARIKTYDDHRMAMSFAMLAAKFPGIEIEDPEVVTKSFPEFWKVIESAGILISPGAPRSPRP